MVPVPVPVPAILQADAETSAAKRRVGIPVPVTIRVLGRAIRVGMNVSRLESGAGSALISELADRISDLAAIQTLWQRDLSVCVVSALVLVWYRPRNRRSK